MEVLNVSMNKKSKRGLAISSCTWIFRDNARATGLASGPESWIQLEGYVPMGEPPESKLPSGQLSFPCPHSSAISSAASERFFGGSVWS
jgi:hypothetical protein